MTTLLNLFDFKQQVDYKTEILAGLTVALALVPEAIAFSFIAGLDPIIGLYAAFVMGLVTSILGGRPGMISGATGAVAIVIAPLVEDVTLLHGKEVAADYVFACVILAGLIQMAAGFGKLGKLMRLVPQSVVYGFVNGLAIVIFTSQFKDFQYPQGHPLEDQWRPLAELWPMFALIALVMFIMWGLPKLTKAIPAGLAGIIAVVVIVYVFQIDTITIGDKASIGGDFPLPIIPQVPLTWETLSLIGLPALTVAGVGLIESLLTLNIIDEITETRGSGNREAVAQGIANFLSGFTGGMGGCAMIGQSLINISSGARARLSGIVASLLFLVFILFTSNYIEQIPMAALIGIMFMVAIGTFEWGSLRTFGRFPKSDIFVIILVTIITVVLDLAVAVIIGVIVASLVFAYKNATMIRARKRVEADGSKHYEIWGPLFFGSVQTFNSKFDVLGDPDHVVIDFMESKVTDMSAVEALNRLTERYAKVGKTVRLQHLSPDCRRLLNKADAMIDVNVDEDPTYKVMRDFA